VDDREENLMAHEHAIHDDLDEALRHCRAGLKALEGARDAVTASGQLYPTHIYLATVELAHAIEVAMKLALREQ
jgi:hypothetical protein